MQASNHAERLERARHSLEGLSVGDAFGGYFFGNSAQRIQERLLPAAPWNFTDDTNMALSIISILRQHQEIDQDHLASSFAERYDRTRGYGPGMRGLLSRLRQGHLWRDQTKTLFGGQGSFGNGSAMRVAPLGAYFADNLEAAVKNAHLSAEVTHAHPEAVAGAIAVAVAAAHAWQLRGSAITRPDFIDRILPFIPDSEVRSRAIRARDLRPDVTIRDAVAALGNGSGISCQDTVGFTLWCAGQYLNNYEEEIWLTASGGGDVDTNCAIVGGIVAAHTGREGIPAHWIESREPLPNWPFSE